MGERSGAWKDDRRPLQRLSRTALGELAASSMRRGAKIKHIEHRLSRNALNALEHDPEKHALGLRPDGWKPVFLATNAERVCAEIMLKQKARAR
jgi:hypothetical protein